MMKAVMSALALSAALFSPLAHADQALANAKACMACHEVAAKKLGPAYKEVAAKYAKDKNAVAYLAEKIQKGSSGDWNGPMAAMPANAVTPDEAKKLATWVMSLK